MKSVEVPKGANLLYAAKRNKINVEGACGGKCKCATCHVILPSDLMKDLPRPKGEEDELLKLGAHVTPESRLGCQVKVDDSFQDAKIILPNIANLEIRR